MDMKKCKFCGAELPAEAAFCHHCASSLLEPQELKPPKRKRKWPLAAAAALVVVCALVLLPREPQEPLPGEPTQPVAESPALAEESPLPEPAAPTRNPQGALLDYEYEGTVYRIICSAAMKAESPADNQYLCSHTIGRGQDFYSSTRLFVFKKSINAAEEFSALVDSIQVSVHPLDGSQSVEIADCWDSVEHPGCLYCTGYFFSDLSYDNLLIWEIRMKNGDILTLQQEIKVHTDPEVSYSFEEYPMNNLEELSKLLSQIYEEQDADTVIKIYLPPVVYEGGLELSKRGISLYGSTDPETGVQTTFTDTVIISGFDPTLPEIVDIVFDTGGTAEGLKLGCSVVAQNCVFRSCSTGVYAGSGGWLIGWNCVFSGNETGLLIDNPTDCQVLNTRYDNCLFENNELAVCIQSMHSDFVFSFPGCSFRGNDQDIVNHTDNAVDTSGCAFE